MSHERKSNDLPPITTLLTPSERPRVDAAGEGCYHTIHRDTVDDLIRDLKSRQVHAVLVSVTCAGAQATRVVRAGDANEVTRFLKSLRVIGPIVLAPATVLVLGFGIWMVLNSPAWDFKQEWVQIALGLFAGSTSHSPTSPGSRGSRRGSRPGPGQSVQR